MVSRGCGGLRYRGVHVVVPRGKVAPACWLGLLEELRVQAGGVGSVGVGVVDIQQDVGLGINIGGSEAGLGGRCA